MWPLFVWIFAVELTFYVLQVETGIVVVPPPFDKAAWFKKLTQEHRHVCAPHNSCLPKLDQSLGYASPCCWGCSCESTCKKYGTCCLDVYSNFADARRTLEQSRYGCVEGQYLSYYQSDYLTDDKVWMITKCDTGYANTDYQMKCENPGLDDRLDSIIPVSDPVSELNYRNLFCAYCNGVEDDSSLISWKFRILSNIPLDWPDKDLLSKLRKTKGNVFYVQPEYIKTEECEPKNYSISTCNETGLWLNYDESIETACTSFIDPFNLTYQNYFCYLCNTENTEVDTDVENWRCDAQPNQIKDITPPFFALLDLTTVTGEEKSATLHCDSSQFADHKLMVCREVFCHKYRQLVNGVCIAKVEANHSSCFGVFMKMTPFSSLRSLTPSEEFYIRQALAERISSYTVTETLFFYRMFDLDQVDFLIVYMTANLTKDNALHNNLHLFLDVLMQLDKDNITAFGRDFQAFFSVDLALYNITFFRNQVVEIFVPNSQNFTLFDIVESGLGDFTNDTCLKMGTSILNKLYVCPFIGIGKNEIPSRIENGVLSIRKGDANKIFTLWEYEVEEDTIYICLDDYRMLYISMNSSDFMDKVITDDFVSPKQILSLVCVCLSLICLLITIVAYGMFTALQTQPGMNNLILCIFLFLAQPLYQFGAGQPSLSDLACSVIGAICHFLWLAVIFAMHICSINMFIIFRSHVKLSSTFNWNHIIKNLSFVVCASLLFVCINLVASLGLSDGSDTGYGGKVCFISSNIMQSVTFIVPAAFTLGTNIVLFSYVVYRIRRNSSFRGQLNKDRNYLGIYARLSTLTGLTWMFGFLRIFLKFELLEYLFIIFNTSQGVFIMIGFVLNRRVFSQCLKKDALVQMYKTNETNETTESNRENKN